MENFNFQRFTKRERRSILLFLLLISGLLLVLFLLNRYDRPEAYKLDDVLDKKYQDSLGIKAIEKSNNNFRLDTVSISKQTNAVSFKFNPNYISKDSLMMLGVDKYTAENLIKYRNKGGVFKTKEKFFQIYGMNKYQARLDSLITLDSISFREKYLSKTSSVRFYEEDGIKKSNNKSDPSKITVTTLKIIELNSTDSFELETVKGIGTTLANRIIKYRDKLGGFYDVSQLEEVYGMRPENYMNINHLFRVDNSKIKKISINAIDEKTLASHPYFGKKFSSIIIRYRKQHGPYKSLDDIRKVKIFSEEDLEKMKWYLEY